VLSWIKQIDLPRTSRGHAVIVLVLVFGQAFFKFTFAFEQDVGIYPGVAEIIRLNLASHPWDLLLPMEYEPGRIYWPTTILLPLFAFQEIFPPFLVLIFISSMLVVVTYFCAQSVSRSNIFSITMGLISGFGTQLLYAYSIPNLFAVYFFLSYFILSLTALYLLVTRRDKFAQRLALFACSLVFVALGWEQWVNYALWVLLAGIFIAIWNHRHKGPLVFRHISSAMLVTAILLTVYLSVRFSSIQEYAHAGSEEELIFTYPTIMMMVDDFISSFFTFIYTAFSSFFPTFLVTSNTIQSFGFDAIVAEQNGYHEAYQHLVPMHHLFFWRYYAGIVATLFLLFFWQSSIRAWKEPDVHHLLIVLIALMILLGFTPHLLIKYRPYLSVPALPYKATISVFGVSLLIAYMLVKARTWVKNVNMYYCVVWSVWGLIIYEAFSRPKMLSTLLGHVGLVGKTDPAAVLFNFWPRF